MEKKQCRSPSAKEDQLTKKEIEDLMRHSSYERGKNGRMRSRGGRVVVIK